MRTSIISLGLALFVTLGAQAQSTVSPAKTPAKVDRHECIMAGTDTWTSLGLTAEQVAKVKDIQASCKKDYDSTKTDASVMKHEEQLKAVLTPDQYKKWSDWCAENHGSKAGSETTK